MHRAFTQRCAPEVRRAQLGHKAYGHTCRISRSQDRRFHRGRAGQQIACPQLKVTSFEVARSCLESPHQVKVKNKTSRDKKGRKPVHSRTRYIACSPFIAPPGALQLLLLVTIFLEGRSTGIFYHSSRRPAAAGSNWRCTLHMFRSTWALSLIVWSLSRSPATSGERKVDLGSDMSSWESMYCGCSNGLITLPRLSVCNT